MTEILTQKPSKMYRLLMMSGPCPARGRRGSRILWRQCNIVLKRVTMGGGVSEIVQNCVTSFMDVPEIHNYKKIITSYKALKHHFNLLLSLLLQRLLTKKWPFYLLVFYFFHFRRSGRLLALQHSFLRPWKGFKYSGIPELRPYMKGTS